MNGKKIVTVLIATLMIVGISAGALVWFESNLVTDEVNMAAPLNIDYMSDLEITYGGSCEIVGGTITNNANNPISTVLAVAISSPEPYCEDIREFAGCADGGYYGSEYVGYVSFTTDEEIIYLPLTLEPAMPCTGYDMEDYWCMSGTLPVGADGNELYGELAFATTPVITFAAGDVTEFEVDFVTHPEIVSGEYAIYMICVSPEHVMNTVNLVHKDPTDWSVVDSPENGVLSYQLTEDGILTYSYDNPMTGYELVVIMAETTGTGEWPQTGSMALTGTSGVADISALVGCVDDGADYGGSENGVKIWYVPSEIFDGTEFTTWAPGDILFEEDLIVDCTNTCPC